MSEFFKKGQTVKSKTTGQEYEVDADQRGGRVAVKAPRFGAEAQFWKDASDLELVVAEAEEAFDEGNVAVELNVGEEPFAEGEPVVEFECDVTTGHTHYEKKEGETEFHRVPCPNGTEEPHAGYFAKKFDQGKADANLLPGEPTACVIGMMLDTGMETMSIVRQAQGEENIVNSAEVLAGALLFQGVVERSTDKLARAFVALDIANIHDGQGSLLPCVLKVLEFGAKKYAPNSWQTVPDAENRYSNAAKRHWLFPANLRELDDDSKLQHRWHLACNILFLIHFFGKATK